MPQKGNRKYVKYVGVCVCVRCKPIGGHRPAIGRNRSRENTLYLVLGSWFGPNPAGGVLKLIRKGFSHTLLDWLNEIKHWPSA